MPQINRAAVARLLSQALAAQGRGAASKLALAAGVAPSTVTKWRTGETLPAAEVWPKIERSLALAKGSIRSAADEPVDPADAPLSPEEAARLRDENERLQAVVDALIAAKSTADMIEADPLLDEPARARVLGVYLILSGQAET